MGVADDSATSPEQELVGKVITAAGGDEKLLTLFRMEERYNSGKERASPGTSRVSVVEPPEVVVDRCERARTGTRKDYDLGVDVGNIKR